MLDDIWKELNGMTGRRNLGSAVVQRVEYAVQSGRKRGPEANACCIS